MTGSYPRATSRGSCKEQASMGHRLQIRANSPQSLLLLGHAVLQLRQGRSGGISLSTCGGDEYRNGQAVREELHLLYLITPCLEKDGSYVVLHLQSTTRKDSRSQIDGHWRIVYLNAKRREVVVGLKTARCLEGLSLEVGSLTGPCDLIRQ